MANEPYLRYGAFYGPGAIDDQVELVRKRRQGFKEELALPADSDLIEVRERSWRGGAERLLHDQPPAGLEQARDMAQRSHVNVTGEGRHVAKGKRASCRPDAVYGGGVQVNTGDLPGFACQFRQLDQRAARAAAAFDHGLARGDPGPAQRGASGLGENLRQGEQPLEVIVATVEEVAVDAVPHGACHGRHLGTRIAMTPIVANARPAWLPLRGQGMPSAGQRRVQQHRRGRPGGLRR